jgi:hypothetical protein
MFGRVLTSGKPEFFPLKSHLNDLDVSGVSAIDHVGQSRGQEVSSFDTEFTVVPLFDAAGSEH